MDSVSLPGVQYRVSQGAPIREGDGLPPGGSKLIDCHASLSIGDRVHAPVHPLVPDRDLGCTNGDNQQIRAQADSIA